MYIIHTDGNCFGNPGPGGIGFYVSFPDQLNIEDETFCRGFHQTTNNRMELKAGIEALRYTRARRKDLEHYKNIAWDTDSMYIVDNINNVPTWRRNKWEKINGEPVLNEDLWRELYNLCLGLRTFPNWISRENNKIADKLAKQAGKSPSYTDFGFNPGRISASVGDNRQAPHFL